jgi:frataxin
MDESQFHTIADETLEAFFNAIEEQDEELQIDADLTDGILTLELDSGQQYILNKHAPSKQLWLSSPISGGLHYDWNEEEEGWELTKDGSRLDELLTKELYQHTGIAFDLIDLK